MVAKLLSSAETAQILGICTRTLRSHVNAGEIAYVNTGCGTERVHRMFRPSDVEAFIDARTMCKSSRVAESSCLQSKARGASTTSPSRCRYTSNASGKGACHRLWPGRAIFTPLLISLVFWLRRRPSNSARKREAPLWSSGPHSVLTSLLP